MLSLGNTVQVKGFITQEKFIFGRSLSDLESALGFQSSRFSEGIIVSTLKKLPSPNDFVFRGYSQVAGHHYNEQYNNAKDANANMSLDRPAVGESQYDFNRRIEKIKTRIINEIWSLRQGQRLVKIWTNTPHSNLIPLDIQYPPGRGVPQWELLGEAEATVIAIIKDYPTGIYRATM